jgi:nucleotide-binding universal stress UspA family protein
MAFRNIYPPQTATERSGPGAEEAPAPSRVARLLVAVDGSPGSLSTIAEVAGRPWPTGSEIEVVTVIHSQVPFFPDPAFSFAAAHMEEERRQEHAAPALLEEAVSRIRATTPGSTVSSRVLEGDPAEAIVEEAERLRANEIFVGHHGHGAVRRGLLGSVSQKVAHHAHCSVHIVRPHPETAAAA